MNRTQQAALQTLHRVVFAAGIAGVALAEPVQAGLLSMLTVERPAAEEFGAGPRASANRLYKATLQPAQGWRLRQMQTVPVLVLDARGQPVEGATITVDGGMPQHSHGLPTQPKVSRYLGNGVYEIEGLRFSMGGWWEVKLAIDAPAGSDRVTFNLSL
jgi:hypothetical protein